MATRPWSLLFLLALLVPACATEKVGSGATSTAGQGFNAAQNIDRLRGPAPILAGKRCTGETCNCRTSSDAAETQPPPLGLKRIEIRISAVGGKVTLDSPTVGHFEHSGAQEACFYVDLPVSRIHDFHLETHEAVLADGVAPRVHISEYGPAGPFWYDIVDVTCGLGERRCDPELARAWGDGWLAQRKRGRLDACGSIVVIGLKWRTSGGQAAMNGGLLRDFLSDFSLEVKKFATEFPPGAAQCRIGH